MLARSERFWWYCINARSICGARLETADVNALRNLLFVVFKCLVSHQFILRQVSVLGVEALLNIRACLPGGKIRHL